MAEFEPKIVGFFCYWCSYAGADLAGVSRMQYPPNLIAVRTMCTGSIWPPYILKAFQQGADGVLVAGCHIGDCHYLKGNYLTAKRMAVIKQLLEFFGVAGERLRLEWISAGEGEKFARVVTEFTEEVRALGPSPLKDWSRGARV